MSKLATAPSYTDDQVAEETVLICSDPVGNNNKFYRVTLLKDGTVYTNWGRVGATGQFGTEGNGRHAYDEIIRKKGTRGYKPADVLGSRPTSTAAVGGSRLAAAAKQSLAAGSNDKRLLRLVEQMVAVNAHQIGAISGGQIKVQDGAVTTPLGLLSKTAIADAETVLDRIAATAPTARNRPALLSDYLTLVPQVVPRLRGWHEDYLTDPKDVQAQRDFLAQLAQSVDFAAKQSDVAKDDGNVADLFRYRIAPCDDKKTIASIEKFYKGGQNRMHNTYGMKLADVFELSDPKFDAAYQAAVKRVGNVTRLWHGTRTSNVLSMLAKGPFVPPPGAPHVTGRMFGNGLYLSNQATKSLQYAANYGSRVGREGYMFVVDAAMGRSYVPSRGYGDHAGAHRGGYDSINVPAGRGGVVNHEAVVWNLDQVRLSYLVRFTR